jgi:hypothetical protein
MPAPANAGWPRQLSTLAGLLHIRGERGRRGAESARASSFTRRVARRSCYANRRTQRPGRDLRQGFFMDSTISGSGAMKRQRPARPKTARPSITTTLAVGSILASARLGRRWKAGLAADQSRVVPGCCVLWHRRVRVALGEQVRQCERVARHGNGFRSLLAIEHSHDRRGDALHLPG